MKGTAGTGRNRAVILPLSVERRQLAMFSFETP